jgi:hypothetical protein
MNTLSTILCIGFANPVFSLLWKDFFLVGGVCFSGSCPSFHDFTSCSGFLDAETPVLLFSFIASHGQQSCNDHVPVNFC